jgi:hypothetical protein
MGAIVDAISDVFEGVVDAVGDLVDGALDVVDQVMETVAENPILIVAAVAGALCFRGFGGGNRNGWSIRSCWGRRSSRDWRGNT